LNASSAPQIRPVIIRLAELESRAFLTPLEMHELNDLRRELEPWPEIGGALAAAYMT
jgi:hypothetical protein